MASELERWQRAREVFDACIDLAPAARASTLEALCAGDDELRSAVESLLRSHDALTATIGDRIARGINAGVGEVWAEARPGQRFGAFRVVEEIGRGGMGVVYLAERDDGTVAQRVALKVVGNARLGPDATARLAFERRLLATLEHPCIARLIDAGTSASGSAYFAMEYVQGRPITRWCDARSLSIGHRLRLFVDVCSAVQHAHTKLIVHRDLKAANILIRDDGLPKLLDFGIATSLDSDAAAATFAPHERALSPHAAAPEQWLDQPVGAATDVYALGVLLCELVAGVRPHELSGLDADDAAKRVLHEPPRLPSSVVDAESARLRGGIGVAGLRRRLAGDLDAIVARCLAKRPEQRYTSVAQLADDVSRHLERRPIAARLGERGYRMRRFVQRNGLAVALGSIVLALLAGFAVFTALANRELARERDQAQRREHKAKFQQARAQQVSDFLVGLFKATTPEQRRGHDLTVRTLLERGRSELEKGLQQQPDLRASMLAALSDVYFALDDLDEAGKLANDAYALREPARQSDPAALRDSLAQLARLANTKGRYAEALARTDEATALLTDADVASRSALLISKATALRGLAKPADATPLLRENLALVVATYGRDDRHALKAAVDLAINLRVTGAKQEAATLLEDLLPRIRAGLDADDPARADAMVWLSLAKRDGGDPAAAAPLADESLAIYTKVYGENSSQTSLALNTLATIEQKLGHNERALELFQRNLAIKREIYGRDSLQAAGAGFNVGLMQQMIGAPPETTLSSLKEALDIDVEKLPPEHVNTAIFRVGVASTLRELGRSEEAERELRLALGVFDRTKGPRGQNHALAEGELACIGLSRAVSDTDLKTLDASIRFLERADPDDLQMLRLRHCREQFTVAAAREAGAHTSR